LAPRPGTAAALSPAAAPPGRKKALRMCTAPRQLLKPAQTRKVMLLAKAQVPVPLCVPALAQTGALVQEQ